MAEKLIISISGMRGIIGENLNASIAAEYGCAFGTFLKENYPDKQKLSVCLGRDSRPSGQMLSSAVIAGLCSVGIDVIDIGIVPTPSVGVMLRHLKCQGGVMITASHNPLPFNGIKLLLGNGIAPAPEDAQKIISYYHDSKFSLVSSPDCGKLSFDETADDIHIAKVLELINPETVKSKKYKVVLDSVNGAGGRITVDLLNRLGCDVIEMNTEQNGLFAHTPEPIKENLTDLCDKVKQNSAQIGFAQDPDADRLAIVDENGNYIGEEYTLALAAEYIFSKSKGKAAANLSTSRMVDDVALKYGSEVIRTPVGEANVAKAMVENNCLIGGEGNGGVIDLRVGPIRDSILAIALVLQLMAETGKSMSQLVSGIGGYYMHKDKFRATSDQASVIIEKTKQQFPEAKVDVSDGARFDFEDGWLHLRTSNTEPVMRIIVEAREESAARKYLDKIDSIRKQFSNE